MTPPIIPDVVRTFMDAAAASIEALARAHALRVVAYEGAANESIAWYHNYYFEMAGRRASLQLWTDIAHASRNAAIVHLWLFVSKGEDHPWVSLGCEETQSLDEWVRAAQGSISILRRVCALAMPNQRKVKPVA